MVRVGSLALGMVLFVSSLASAAAPAVNWQAWAKRSQGRYAYSVLMGGKKIGWIIEETKLGIHKGMPVVQSMSEEYTETLFDGEKSVKHERSVTSYELTGEGFIVHHDSKKTEDGKQTRRTAERVGNKLRITTEVGTRRVTRDVGLPKETLTHSRELEIWLESPRKLGDRFIAHSTNWDSDDINSKQHYLFKERKKIRVLGKLLDVIGLQITIQGSKMDAQVLPDNRTITADFGNVQSLRLDREENVKKLSSKPFDLMDLTSLYVNRRLGLAAKVNALTLELTGLDNLKVPASHRQLIKSGKKSTIVELRRDFRLDKPADLSKAERQRFLKTTPRFQCDQKPVIETAKKIVGSEKDTLTKAKLIEDWVYKTLKKSYSANSDSALEILENKAGDCTEHSLIFVALCRAAGIPAREVGGLAYVGGKKPSFGWHAWAEIHDGHQWITVDPTWHQVYIDGTHLKLSEGDQDLTWTNVLGTLKMKVIAVTSKD